MNKDEAEKCKDIAKKAIATHDYEKALRFLHKSAKLFPSHEADGLISLWEMNLKNRAGSSGASNAASAESSGPHKRHHAEKTKDDEPPKEKNYTPAQAELWQKILSKSTYYDILGVDKKATEDEIKRAYKKLALKLHPDKNNAPKATEAFKKVSTAYMWLSDEEKRKIYDEHGTEENFRQNYRQYFREEDDMDFFDLFDLFAGGYNQRLNRQRRYHNQRNGHPHPQQGRQQNQWQQFVPLLILLFVFLMVNIGNNFSSGPSYSFTQSDVYKYELQTSTYNVKYFVDESTYETIRGSSRTTRILESQIENDYYKINIRKCRQAKESQNHWVRQANRYSKGHHRYNQYMKNAQEINLEPWEIVQEMQEKEQ